MPAFCNGSKVNPIDCLNEIFSILRTKFSGGGFKARVLTLLTGTAVAQAITFLISPALTRIYSPADFGVYSVYLAIVMVLAEIAGGKFEMAVILPAKDEGGFEVLALACLAVSLSSGIFLVIALVAGRALGELPDVRALSGWLYVIPLLVFLLGIYNALNYWNNRRAQFRRLAINRVLRASLGAVLNLALGYMGFGASGLILGGLAGQAATTGLFVWQIWREDGWRIRHVSKISVREQLARYRDFPLYLLPSSFIETLSGQLPLVLISSLFGTGTLGLLALATRVVYVPMSLLADSVREVFRQAASHQYARDRQCRPLFLKTFYGLLALAVLPALMLFCLGPGLFAVVFGEKWRAAGEFAQQLSVMFFLRFVSSPLSCMFLIAEKQRWDLIIQVCHFLILVSMLLLAARLGATPRIAVGIYSAVYGLKYLVELYFSYRFAKNIPFAAQGLVNERVKRAG